jgi:hypothetical protein
MDGVIVSESRKITLVTCEVDGEGEGDLEVVRVRVAVGDGDLDRERVGVGDRERVAVTVTVVVEVEVGVTPTEADALALTTRLVLTLAEGNALIVLGHDRLADALEVGEGDDDDDEPETINSLKSNLMASTQTNAEVVTVNFTVPVAPAENTKSPTLTAVFPFTVSSTNKVVTPLPCVTCTEVAGLRFEAAA